MRIGIDLMGSDRSHEELFKAVLLAAKNYPNISFVVYIAEDLLSDFRKLSLSNILFSSSKEVISMDEAPVKAVRTKKNSSLVKGIKDLKKQDLDAFITAGNTGALIAAATTILEKQKGITRPALMASLPSSKGCISLLDAGGSVQCRAHLLYQYALLGAEYHALIHKKDLPVIGLLNVGYESKKGTLEHQEAFRLLSGLPNFYGNIEGRDVFEGHIDVLVTDGFTGNVFLKTAEGTAAFIFNSLELKASDEVKKQLKPLYDRFNWAKYPGAILVGVKGLVMKCHGSSGQEALLSSIECAISLIKAK